MSEESKSTRRSFLKGGAIVVAPLATIGVPAAAALAGDGDRDKLARLQDEKAIRDLHASWLRQVNSGNYAAAARLYADDKASCALAGIASVAADQDAEGLEFARDGKHASATYAAHIEVETAIAPDHTLAQMLHAQGEGMVRTSEQRMLKADYVRTPDGGWAIAKLDFQRA
ncbi:MAG TPA: nuclear transport factor 2 family protein [Sphingobium sp.]